MPTILRKDEQLLCDLFIEAAVTWCLRADGCSRLLCGPQCVVCIVDHLWSRHRWPGAIDVWELEEGSGLDGLCGLLNIELQKQIVIISSLGHLLPRCHPREGNQRPDLL
jgi:hypothetical protein